MLEISKNRMFKKLKLEPILISMAKIEFRKGSNLGVGSIRKIEM